MADRLRTLFDAALEHSGAARDGFIQASCPDDETLRLELKRLLAAHDRAGSFLDGPALASVADDGPDWVGRRLGVYEIVREIGRGGMGVVFLATRADELFRKQVAIKVLRSNLDGRELLDRFHRERHILASLDHSNIARLIDGGTTEEGLPYVVMEYVEGQPIDAFCRERQLSLEQRLELFKTLCSAVHYAHQNLVVHRDLKPSNIVVTAEGQPKLLDFGIAKLLETDTRGETNTGMRPMTLAYASPEQITGEAITTGSDVYALGVVLYELVSGARPFPGDSQSDHEMMRQICDQVPDAPSKAVTRDPADPGLGAHATPAHRERCRHHRLEGASERARATLLIRRAIVRRHHPVSDRAAGAGPEGHGGLSRGEIHPAPHGRGGRERRHRAGLRWRRDRDCPRSTSRRAAAASRRGAARQS